LKVNVDRISVYKCICIFLYKILCAKEMWPKNSEWMKRKVLKKSHEKKVSNKLVLKLKISYLDQEKLKVRNNYFIIFQIIRS